MRTIAYYISDYGYGHASRSISIIRELLAQSDVHVIICHSFALDFIQQSLNSNRVSYRNIKTDIGYILERDSINPDRKRLLVEYKRFVADWEHKSQKEIEFLKENRVDLVISDISPLPFKAAATLGIPSVGISNFTWYTAYEGLIDDKELDPFKESYEKMTQFFSLAGSKENWDVPSTNYGFFSRKVDIEEVKKIRQLVNPNGNLKVVFIGLGMKIDVGSLEELPVWDSPNCVFIVSSNVQVDLPNVYRIPTDYLESQNFIAASDLVISKAGWGMIGEALSANVPLLILDRPTMREDQNTIQYLKQHRLCKTIDWEEFKTYQIELDAINENNYDFSNNNQAAKIAETIGTVLEGSSGFNNY